jgi:methylase of polypeptide subunit release factors
LSTTEITYQHGSERRRALWLAQGMPVPDDIATVDDRTTADAALALARRGKYLLYLGDYQNARQLLAAMGRRLARRRRPVPSGPSDSFRQERSQRRLEHDLLSRLLVPVEPDLTIPLQRAPDLRQAIAEAWTEPPTAPTLVPLREILGMVGAHQWRAKGVPVAALDGRIHPHYGVFAPIRGEYVDLVAAELDDRPPSGKRAFDIGTGTGVLAILLARRGWRVTATDDDPRAVACARENAVRFGIANRIEILQADLFPPGCADLVVMNPPWMPEDPVGPLDHAVYDPGGQVLARFLSGLTGHLEPGGRGWLVLSDLAELLGLRPRHQLSDAFSRAGLRVERTRSTPAAHPRARDPDDPLHAARSLEKTVLHCLVPIGCG